MSKSPTDSNSPGPNWKLLQVIVKGLSSMEEGSQLTDAETADVITGAAAVDAAMSSLKLEDLQARQL